MVEACRLFRFPCRAAVLVLMTAAGAAFAQTMDSSPTRSSSQIAAISTDGIPAGAGGAFLPASGESKRQEAAEAGAGQAACPKIANQEIPLNEVVDARVSGWLDSGHLKPGKEFWLKVAYPINYQDCSLDNDSVIYGKVVSATSTKDPNSSELTVSFDQADCGGKKKSLKFWLIAVMAPPDEMKAFHDAVPTQVAGGGRRISDTNATTADYDAMLNPGGAPHTVKPGVVVGYPKIKLDPSGGEGCNAKLSSTDRTIHLGTGARLFLMPGQVK